MLFLVPLVLLVAEIDPYSPLNLFSNIANYLPNDYVQKC